MSFEARLITAYVAITIAFIIAGGIYLERQQEDARSAAWQELSAIADLKAAQINNWRNERLGDARFFSQARFVARDVQRMLEVPQDETARNEVRHWLELLKGGNRYKTVMLWDSSLKQQVAVPSDNVLLKPSVRQEFEQVMRTNKIIMTDLIAGDSGEDIHMDLLFPIAEPESLVNGQTVGSTQTNIALVLLRLDPREFLYPLIRTWPTSSRTAETLLVRREGHEVIYLNDLRYQAGAALKLRLPLDRADLPAAVAVRGESRVIEGKDYRGVKVVAVGRAISGTPWYMIAKVDQEELYAPLRRQAWTVGAGLLALLLSCGLLTALLWRYRVADELRRTNQELERRVQKRTADIEYKNNELEIFTYSVTHDLKAPLRSIDGFSSILLEDYQERLDESGRKYLTKIRNSVCKMNQLIDDLLRYSRLDREEITLSRIDVSALVNSLVDECSEEIRKGNIHVKIDISCAPIHADAAALTQALRNLVGNAVKFSSRVPQPLVQIRCLERGHSCVIEIHDNGIGFDNTDSEKVFDIFHRLPGAGEFPGTGVGLAIVRKAMQRMGGRVWAQSELGKGAVFFLEIPRG